MATILVVDDEKDVVTLIKFLLEKDGHRVVEAYNGTDAVKLLGLEPSSPPAQALTPDLIVLDVMMPGMDGFTVNARLQGSAHTRSIPVVVLTARGQMRDLFEMSSNVAAYLEKPFDPGGLRTRVQEVLQRKKPG